MEDARISIFALPLRNVSVVYSNYLFCREMCCMRHKLCKTAVTKAISEPHPAHFFDANLRIQKCSLPIALWVHNNLPTLYPHVPVTNEYPVYFLCTCFRTMMDRIIIAKAKDGKRPPPFCSFFFYLCQNIHGKKTTTFFRGLFPQFPARK